MASDAKDIKLPFKMRLKAWWEGYDPEEMKEQMFGSDSEGTPEAKKPVESVSTPEDLDPIAWTEKRIKVAELVWGDGYCGPGGPEHIKSLSKLLAMTSEMSVAVIGAGLGGPTRVLADEFSAWISGFEESPELVKRGNELSIEANLKDKAAIVEYDPAAEEPFDRNFDRCFAKEAIYTIEDKPRFLSKIHEKLKDDALFLITDYCLTESASLTNPDMQKWVSQEAITPHLIPQEDMAKLLKDTGFNVRVDEDISQDYIKLISNSWSGAEKIVASLVSQGEMDTVQILMKDAEFWNLRSQLLKDGHLQVRRYLAHKSKKI